MGRGLLEPRSTYITRPVTTSLSKWWGVCGFMHIFDVGNNESFFTFNDS